MSEDKTTDGGLTETPAKSSVIDLKEFIARKREGKETQPSRPPWPSPSSLVTQSSDGSSTAISAMVEPLERKILISTPVGEVIQSGFLGLSQTFLAVGDARGQIKFACAPGQWLYAYDVTDIPEEVLKAILEDNAKK